MDRLKALLHVSPLIVALAFALILKVAVIGLAAGFPFAYLLIGIVVWSGANYFVELIETQSVEDTWAVFSVDTLSTTRRQLGIVWLLLLGIAAAIVWALFSAGAPQLAWLFAGVIGVFLPASTALLAVTANPLRALHPGYLIGTVSRMGLRYLWLLGVLAAVVAAISFGYRTHGFIAFFVASYVSFVFAHLIGSVVYARRAVLGVHAPRSPEAKMARELERLLAERARVLDHAYGIAAHGNVSGGLKYLESYVLAESDPLSARVWMFNEMTHWDDPRAALAFAENLIAQLETGERGGEAAKVRLACGYLKDRLR
jgi:hypothetical protein